MMARRIDGIEVLEFPSDLDGHPLLAWMGDDWVRFVALKLLAEFRRQDPGTEMAAIRCEGAPELETRVREGSGAVTAAAIRLPVPGPLPPGRPREGRPRQSDHGAHPDRDRSRTMSPSGAPDIVLTIEFLYLAVTRCSRCRGTAEHLDDALPLIRPVLEATGFDVHVERIHVQSEEQAIALGLLVSPTIRVNGRDIQLNWRETPCDARGSPRMGCTARHR